MLMERVKNNQNKFSVVFKPYLFFETKIEGGKIYVLESVRLFFKRFD